MKDIGKEQDILGYCTVDGRLIPQRCTIPVLKKRGWYSYLLQRYDDNVSCSEKLSVSETLYRMLNNLDSVPLCKVCGGPVRYTPARGYADFCSKKCQNSDPEVLEKNRFGVSKSLIAAYNERGDIIKAKRGKSLEKYGANTSSPFSSTLIREKAGASLIEKYGVDNVMKLPEFHAYAKPIARKRSVGLWESRGYDIEYRGDKVVIKNGCGIHGDIELSVRDFCNRMKAERRGSSVICPVCHPISTYSGEEKSFARFLDSLGLEYVRNDRTAIKPLELDFFFPRYKIAIELNGLLYHSELFKEKYYHLNKLRRCDEAGIRLVSIWEDEWAGKTEIVKSMVRNIFGRCDDRVYARNCAIRELTPCEYRAFMDDNHLQGSVNAAYKFGLVYKGEIVAAMGFGSMRISLGSGGKEGMCELYRYCCRKNLVVPGAASKLFKHAVKALKREGYTDIVTYAKRDFSVGGLYRELGFEYAGETVPGYFWTNGRGRINRFSVRKSELVNAGGDSNLTEAEIMHGRHFYRCYDTGNLKFMYKI